MLRMPTTSPCSVHRLLSWGRSSNLRPFALPRPDALSPLPTALPVWSLVSAYTTNNLRTPLLLRGMITPSPAPPDLSGRDYGLSFAGFGWDGVNESAAPSVFL